ncbi:acetyltransferase (GNAT) family protein [Nocardioides albertanoniae]|uniref:Acetyltransferase (GNAT) family protein n=1 Tax=Nocardioides albertanoniae TaxID=1175486 RepID=A0A543A3K0_9ACTN|nr:GNAT family N-acetyltransferase [Nocardioides albertanoniae]TQL67163.1 acetyltransferase (GNAT) family protein [Nocardioides albertanoniae]
MSGSTGLVIERIDPLDDAFDAWFDAVTTSWLDVRGPDADVWAREELHAELRQKTTKTDRRAYLARVDGTVVGGAWLAMPLVDNVHRAMLVVAVLPAHRRHGHGTALLEHVEAEARAAGRTSLAGEVWWPWSLGSTGDGSPGREFAVARGYAAALIEVRRVLRLPVAAETLDRLAAEAAERHGAYTLRSWVGPVPDDIVESWAALDASLETEAPTGDLDVEAPKPDVGRVREMEQLVDAQKRTLYHSVALDAHGAVVAYTVIGYSSHDGNSYQWGTLVEAAHRGHRLGLAVKVANLRLLQSERPEVPTVSTYNAEVNAHMIHVNEAMGFDEVEWLASFQK